VISAAALFEIVRQALAGGLSRALARSVGRKWVQRTRVLLGALPLGTLGGFLLGFLVLSFGDLIGRSGTTGSEFVGYMNPRDTAFEAAAHGTLVGALALPAVWLAELHRVRGRALVLVLGLAAGGTLVGGLLGALGSPPLAVVGGCIGLYFASRWAVTRSRRAV
jgi:hypothetical protein